MKTFFALTTGLLAGFMAGGIFMSWAYANDADKNKQNNVDEEYQPKHARESEQNA